MPSAERKTHFKTIQKFQTDYATSVFTEYVSERTGMTVVVVDQKGPKVFGFFALATEIHDDSGAPHTLEHLIFMGSKSYRFKGVLDKLATRAYSNTNAWTATDHTAYTLDTAGWEGFAQILPVYLEHVILPTLTDEGCYTEVHHVDGTGHDAGVVYSEMQGVQNNQGELMDLKARRLIYPEEVGFRYETGGMMEQLRVLTADRIRDFHREMYQPKNLCLVIIGEVDHSDLLTILDKFEGDILDDIPKPDAPFKRPWIESKQTPPLEKSEIQTVEFPEEDESTGEILIGFLGPDCNDTLLTSALNILLVYLAGSSVSILENTLVEKEQVASAVYYSTDNRPKVLIWFSLSSVATEKLSGVEKRFFEVLQEASASPLDMEYLRDCVRRQRRQLKFEVEGSGAFFADPIINDFLFGKRDGSTLRDLATLKEYDDLEQWTDAQWRGFLRRWISDANHVSILGVPSANMSKKLKADEEARVAAQKERLGEEGLKKLEKKLADAKAKNDREVPREILEQFKVPGTDSIHFIGTTTARSGHARKLGRLENPIQKIVDQDTDLPLFIQFEHIPTNFVHFTLVLSTGTIPVQLRPLLSVYIMNFFDTPIVRKGHRVEFEKVVTELEKDTISYTIDGGSYIGNPEVLRIRFQVEPEKYDAAIRWLKELLWDGIFDEMRLKATVTKILADIPEEKRSGNSMANAVDTMIHYSPESSSRARNTLVKAPYIKRISRLLKDEPHTVITQLENIRKSLCRFENFRVLVIANLEKLKKPVSSWSTLIQGLDTSKPLNPLDLRIARLSEAGKNPGKLSYIIPMPTSDSSFSLHTARGPDSYDHPQLPTLMVAVAYLDAVEGPLWANIRGTGLAYGTRFARSTESGLLQYRIYRSPDAYKAFALSKKVIEDFISGATPFDPPALEGAISSIVVAFADEQPTMADAAQLSFVNQVVRGLPADFNDTMLKMVREVGVENIKKVLESVVLPVFMPGKADVVVTCAPIMEEAIKKGFEESGFKPEVQPLTFFQDDYGLKAKDGEDDAEDEEDDMEGEEDGEEDEEGDGSEDN
ncbi:MAG: hypothetical protein M1827_000758 [Pycnora praestabilis]|nr:MAG: hypothetical protein M1827_000758 [Pycnora praestabilis]